MRYAYKYKSDRGKQMKIVVLAGGNSTERDVSLVSGTGVYKALKSKGHKVLMIDPYLGIKDVDVDNIFEDARDWSEGVKQVSELNPDLNAIKALKGDSKCFFGDNVVDICAKADIVFMALHGANGEDGRIQAAFDLYGIKYTGTDYLSAAICMDKETTKKFFISGNVSTPKGEAVHANFSKKEAMAISESVGYPQIVKTCCGGSSIGVNYVYKEEDFVNAIEESFKYGDSVLVEQLIAGREFTCGIIEGKALPIVEIAPKEGTYDYKNKYQAGSTVETCPAQISDELTKAIQAETEKAYKVLGLHAYARIDFMVDKDTNIPYCLEANTLPGMTPTSLLPQEAAANGMNYEDLCEHIIKVSLKKYE